MLSFSCNQDQNHSKLMDKDKIPEQKPVLFERKCLRAALTQEVRVALFCTSKLFNDFSLHNQSTEIIKSLEPERWVEQKMVLPQQNLTNL